jgi:TRAP-type C4-dicarboxylate transport system permease large subunit
VALAENLAVSLALAAMMILPLLLAAQAVEWVTRAIHSPWVFLLAWHLFLASYRFGKPMSEVYRAVVPMLLVRFVAVLLITYLPPLTTTLPRWFGR